MQNNISSAANCLTVDKETKRKIRKKRGCEIDPNDRKTKTIKLEDVIAILALSLFVG